MRLWIIRRWLMAAGLLAVGQISLAQEDVDPLINLERRIEALERENEALRETVSRRLPVSDDAPATGVESGPSHFYTT
ncbi:MAG TPA: hypothetical protein VMP01_09855, partial [Pirellulaceae bacterium]|nr:hypothetical protein [Pirellulaceae bacterium]